MKWRARNTKTRRGPRVFVHVGVELTAVVKIPKYDKVEHTKVMDCFVEEDVAWSLLNVFRTGCASREFGLTETGDFFTHPRPLVSPYDNIKPLPVVVASGS